MYCMMCFKFIGEKPIVFDGRHKYSMCFPDVKIKLFFSFAYTQINRSIVPQSELNWCVKTSRVRKTLSDTASTYCSAVSYDRSGDNNVYKQRTSLHSAGIDVPHADHTADKWTSIEVFPKVGRSYLTLRDHSLFDRSKSRIKQLVFLSFDANLCSPISQNPVSKSS